MSANSLRQKYNRQFARMDKYSTAFAWFVVLSYIAQILLAVAAGAYLITLSFSGALLVGVALIMLFIGTRFRGLNNIIHECSHATFSAERSANTSIGNFCAMLLLSSFSDYRDEHLSHHAHLGDYDHDMDLQGIKDLKLHEPLTTRVFVRHLITPILGRHLPYYLNLNFSKRDGVSWVIAKAIFLFLIAVLLVLFPITTVTFLVLPYVLVYSALNYWADCMDHAGIVASPDDLQASRNILAPKLLRSLFFPRNDCFHLVHHLFPQIPASHLEASHNALLQEPSYRMSSNAVRTRDLQIRPISTEEILAK